MSENAKSNVGIGAAERDVQPVVIEPLLPEEFRQTGFERAGVGLQQAGWRSGDTIDGLAVAFVERDVERGPGDPHQGLQIEHHAGGRMPNRHGAGLLAARNDRRQVFNVAEVQKYTIFGQVLSECGDSTERRLRSRGCRARALGHGRGGNARDDASERRRTHPISITHFVHLFPRSGRCCLSTTAVDFATSPNQYAGDRPLRRYPAAALPPAGVRAARIACGFALPLL